MHVQSLVQEDPLEECMTTHSSILAWRMPWTEEPGGLQSTGWQRVRQDWSDLAHILYTEIMLDSLEKLIIQTHLVELLEESWLSLELACPTLYNPMDCSLPGSSTHGISPGKKNEVGYHFLLQGIFWTQESNPSLLQSRWVLHALSHQEDLALVVRIIPRLQTVLTTRNKTYTWDSKETNCVQVNLLCSRIKLNKLWRNKKKYSTNKM